MSVQDVSPKHAVDAGMAVTVGLAWYGYLPYIAAGFAVLWYVIQMYDWAKKTWNARKSKKRRASDK